MGQTCVLNVGEQTLTFKGNYSTFLSMFLNIMAHPPPKIPYVKRATMLTQGAQQNAKLDTENEFHSPCANSTWDIHLFPAKTMSSQSRATRDCYENKKAAWVCAARTRTVRRNGTYKTFSQGSINRDFRFPTKQRFENVETW